MYNISLLTIGDEICIGQIVNTNASWISSGCTRVGARVFLHSIVGDNSHDIISELDRLIPVSDFIIITGGLGPTHDDITKSVLTEYFDDELIFNKDIFEHLKDMFALRGYEFTDKNKEQALLPSKAKILSNSVGTAPGMLFQKDGKNVVSLPGVPSEMKAIMNEHVFPFIKSEMADRSDDIVLFKTLQTTSVPESKLAELIGEPEKFLNGGSLAFLPSYRGVKLRIGVSSNNFEDAESKINIIEKYINKRVGQFVFALGEKGLINAVADLLILYKKTVSVAESCTGGLLGGEFTSLSGSSAYFAGGVIVYSNEMKEKILGVQKESLDNYGAVSEQVAKELAANVRMKFDTDYGIGITGIAGPAGGSDEKPVGTVWIALADTNGSYAKRYVFSNDRYVNRERSVGTALAMLLKLLKENG